MILLRGATSDPAGEGAGAAFEMATAEAMLRRVARGDSGPVVRIYRPRSAALAFGRRDARLAGFEEAAAVARAAGFEPCLRSVGGRAAAYTSEAVVVDHVEPEHAWPSGLEQRFADFGELWQGVLRDLGVDARVGEVPGEYCPGSHSVNARGEVKLVGTAQRLVRGAWLLSAVLVVGGSPRLRPVLRDVYAALGLPYEPHSTGSVLDETRGLTFDAVEAAVLDAYAGRFTLEAVPMPQALRAEAGVLVDRHRV